MGKRGHEIINLTVNFCRTKRKKNSKRSLHPVCNLSLNSSDFNKVTCFLSLFHVTLLELWERAEKICVQSITFNW